MQNKSSALGACYGKLFLFWGDAKSNGERKERDAKSVNISCLHLCF